MKTATKSFRVLHGSVKTQGNDHTYQNAWARFDRVAAQVRTLWKTKKTTLQILREERR